MTIKSAVTKRFDNGYVQVEIESKRQDTRYYKVPEAKADMFQRVYKNNSKKMPWINTGLTLGAIVATIFPIYLLTKKLQSKSARTLIGVLAGLTGGIGSMYLGANIEANSHDKLLKKYKEN